MNRILVILLSLSIIACNKEESKETSAKFNPPQPDLATPDKVLNSYWAFQIWQDTTYSTDTTIFRFYSSRVRRDLTEKYAKQKAALKAGHYRLRNHIDKVNIESDSRAVVMVKELGYIGSDDFNEGKYVLTRENNQWLVDDILELCWNCKGEGKSIDFLSGYPYTKKSCKYCGGLGWISSFHRK